MAFGYAEAPAKPERDDTAMMDAVAVKALSRVFDAWRVNASDAATLASVSGRTWTRMRSNTWSGALSVDQRSRASAIVGLYKGLHLYFGDELADAWIKRRNRGPLFEGASPLETMIEGGLPAILRVRDYVDAIRGGV